MCRGGAAPSPNSAPDTRAKASRPTVPARRTIRTGPSATPAESSASTTNSLHRTRPAFTDQPVDGIGLRLVVQTRCSPPRSARSRPRPQPARCCLASRPRTPACSSPSLTGKRFGATPIDGHRRASESRRSWRREPRRPRPRARRLLWGSKRRPRSCSE
jgi:hypothetical protein